MSFRNFLLVSNYPCENTHARFLIQCTKALLTRIFKGMDSKSEIKMRTVQNTGPLGEELVVRFLMKRGHCVVDRNFRRPWGELDIVSKMNNVIHFIEVKSTSSCVNSERLSYKARDFKEIISIVTHETSAYGKSLEPITSRRYERQAKDHYRPEDNVHPAKMKRLKRIIQTYLNTRHVSDETNWQFDVATVYIDKDQERARINLLENLIL